MKRTQRVAKRTHREMESGCGRDDSGAMIHREPLSSPKYFRERKNASMGGMTVRCADIIVSVACA